MASNSKIPDRCPSMDDQQSEFENLMYGLIVDGYGEPLPTWYKISVLVFSIILITLSLLSSPG